MFKKYYQQGRAIRDKVPRDDHAAWKKYSGRTPVYKMIEATDHDRIPELVPIRHFRMSESPFAFYRASASIMAGDLSHTPSSGIKVHANGDCHLMNVGGYATPERNIVFDLNDFDETHPGPWEWDVKRLATSFVLAARHKKMSDNDAVDLTFRLINSYKTSLAEYAQMKFLDLWYLKFDLQDIMQETRSAKVKELLSKAVKKADRQTHDQVIYKITKNTLNEHAIFDQPPLVYHPNNKNESIGLVNAFMDKYKNTLQPDRRFLVEQYKVIDVALKVVGVGSVGTRCFVVLLMNDNKEPLFIQVKEAKQSVLEPFTQPGIYKHWGERVVQGQRLIQAASDIFLGWSMGPHGRHYYLRQLRDKKISPQVENYDKQLMGAYAKLCGSILARAHAKTGKGAVICGYIGNGMTFGKAVSKFARAYADQTESDYDDFMKAIKNGKLIAHDEKVSINLKI